MIGTAVHDARTRMGWTLAQAAKLHPVDARSWSTVEKGGRVKDKTYEGIAATFGLPADLVKTAPTSQANAARLVRALALVSPRDGELPAPETVDPVALDDAQLLALLDAVTSELKARLHSRAGKLQEVNQILNDRRQAVRPAAQDMGRTISREMARDGA